MLNLQYCVDSRLKFVSCIYDSAVAVFLETKRKIENEEDPYVDRRPPEAEGEMFLEEWEQADVALDVLGMACIGRSSSCFTPSLRRLPND